MGKRKSFEDKVVVISGAASGIGLAIAKRVVHSGARVVMTDLNEEVVRTASQLSGDRGQAEGYTLDVTDYDAFVDLLQTVKTKYGQIDYLFNNAGINIPGRVHELDVHAWNKVLDVNIRGVSNGINAVYPLMIEQGFGHIVNTASLAGFVSVPGLVPYVASKHAVLGMSVSLRYEAAKHGVDVTAICPGLIETPLLRGAADHADSGVIDELPVKPLSAEECAKQACAGVLKNKDVVLITTHAKVLSRLYRFIPDAWHGLMGQVMAKASR